VPEVKGSTRTVESFEVCVDDGIPHQLLLVAVQAPLQVAVDGHNNMVPDAQQDQPQCIAIGYWAGSY